MRTLDRYPSPFDTQEVRRVDKNDRIETVRYKILKKKDRYIIIEPETFSWINISSNIYGIIREISTETLAYEFFKNHKSYFTSWDSCAQFLAELYNKGILKINKKRYFNSKYYATYKENFPPLLILKVTNECNMKCIYCYSPCDERHTPLDISIALKGIDELIKLSKGEKVTVCFHGGEPLLEKEKIKNIVQIARRKYSSKQIEFVIQTNATLLDDEFVGYCKENNIEIGISIDGSKKINDRTRVFRSGKGSYKDILNGIYLLKKNSYNEISAIVCVTSINDNNLLDIVMHLQKIGVTSIKFSIFYPSGRGNKKAYLLPSPVNLFNSYKKIIEAIINNELKDIFVQSLAYYINNIITYEKFYMCARSPCGAGTSCIGMDTNGDIYTCDSGIGIPQFRIGDIKFDRLKSMLLSDKNMCFKKRTVDKLDKCNSCIFKQTCCGTCTCTAYLENGNIYSHNSIECYLNKNFYEYLLWRIYEEPNIIEYFIKNSKYSTYYQNIKVLD